MKDKESKGKKGFKLVALLASIFFIFAFIILSSLVFQNYYSNKVYPGIKIGNLDLGGKTKMQVSELLNQFAQKFQEEGIVYIATNDLNKTRRVKISPTIISPQDPDLSREILNFEIKENTEAIYSIGRQGNFLKRYQEIIKNFISKKQVSLIYRLYEDELTKVLKDNFKDFENSAVDAKLEAENEIFKITEGEKGFAFDYQKGIKELNKNIGNFIYQPVYLSAIVDYPKITKTQGELVVEQAYQLAKLIPLELTYKKKLWSQPDIKPFLNLKLDKNSRVIIGLDQGKYFAYLNNLAKEIDVEAKNAEIVMKDGKVNSFRPSILGLKLNLEKSFQKIEGELIARENKKIELIVEEENPKILISDINDLGIKELIGAGESNFAGSPKNRRTNIKVGAEKLNGILIKPGETFSLNAALGNIGSEEGFLQELVIKGNRTVPEYGGGLCQIGTTAFRAALYSGLPITERRPHSYRVSYYEPAGMDATIYGPHPDLVFINDTPAHILFLTRIDSDNLFFEFWGTNDGRIIEISKPKITNIKSPGPTRYIETEDLKPGEKKRIEGAHAGADAEFTRTITYPYKDKFEEVWSSHYKPWQEVYLIGKKADSATTTSEIIQ